MQAPIVLHAPSELPKICCSLKASTLQVRLHLVVTNGWWQKLYISRIMITLISPATGIGMKFLSGHLRVITSHSRGCRARSKRLQMLQTGSSLATAARLLFRSLVWARQRWGWHVDHGHPWPKLRPRMMQWLNIEETKGEHLSADRERSVTHVTTVIMITHRLGRCSHDWVQ